MIFCLERAGSSRFAPPACPVDSEPQLLNVERLFQEIYRAVLEQFHRSFRMLDPAKTNNWRRERKFGGNTKQRAIRLLIASLAIQVQQDYLSPIYIRPENRCLRGESLQYGLPGAWQRHGLLASNWILHAEALDRLNP